MEVKLLNPDSVFKEVQFSKACSAIDIEALFSVCMSVKALQLLKAYGFMLVTVSGSIMDFNDVQLEKQFQGINDTVPIISTFDRLVQSEKVPPL